jgi:hypothetical protein
MNKELSKIADNFCPKSSDDDAPFPNYSDSDIWNEGFLKGIEIATKVMIGDFSNQTQKWLVEAFKVKFNKLK